MQILAIDPSEEAGSKKALNLLNSYAFVADAWPGWDPAQAAQSAWEHLGRDTRLLLGQEADGPTWLAGVDPLEFDSGLFRRSMAMLRPLAHRAAWPEPEALVTGRQFLQEVAARSREEGIECLVARVPGRDIMACQCLEGAGFRLMDASVEWMLELKGLPARKPPPAGLSIRTWRPDDLDRLAAIAAESFCDLSAYTDRFAVDPRLRPHCGELYRRWIVNSVEGDQADQVLVLDDSGDAAGFITLRLPTLTSGPAAQTGQVVINAVRADLRGQGLYHRLLLRGLEWLAKHNCLQARVRTKHSQQAVIRAWSRLGARLAATDFTFHNWLDS